MLAVLKLAFSLLDVCWVESLHPTGSSAVSQQRRNPTTLIKYNLKQLVNISYKL